MNKTISMRDAFFMQLHDIAKNDREVIIISGDMGAPALDKFRMDFGNRFINIGIAEHNMVAVATGLAKEGKKVYTYAIAPFVTSRCYEFAKIDASLMKIPLKFVGVGAGFGYEDSGPTHHTTEDISIMRVLPNFEIFSPADSIIAAKCAPYVNDSKNPSYIRLDRQLMPQIYNQNYDIERGFEELIPGKEIAIVSTGKMVHSALKVSEKLQNRAGVIDLYRIKPLAEEFVQTLTKYKKIITLEEHLLAGGLGSLIAETICDNQLDIKIKRMGIDDKYLYLYGRDTLHKAAGIDEQSIECAVRNF